MEPILKLSFTTPERKSAVFTIRRTSITGNRDVFVSAMSKSLEKAYPFLFENSTKGMDMLGDAWDSAHPPKKVKKAESEPAE